MTIRLLKDPKHDKAIGNAMVEIKRLFEDTELFKERYGVEEGASIKLNAYPKHNIFGKEFLFRDKYNSFMEKITKSNDQSHAPSVELTSKKSNRDGFLSRARWAIRDNNKFENLVRDLKRLIDQLASIIGMTPIDIEKDVAFHIRDIRNIDELIDIESATEVDYPLISMTANAVADVLSKIETESMFSVQSPKSKDTDTANKKGTEAIKQDTQREAETKELTSSLGAMKIEYGNQIVRY